MPTRYRLLTHEPADHFSLPISICIFASITSYPLLASPSDLDRRSQSWHTMSANLPRSVPPSSVIFVSELIGLLFSPLSLFFFASRDMEGRYFPVIHFRLCVCMRRKHLARTSKRTVGLKT
ncbi:hypothetical protein E4T47_04435 [Aureobasidium subglaciale]|nr:hypothetical protein E4T47_04435 [Aureobasidium subglaciale]